MNGRQALGRWGEAAAAEYLQRQGYTIVDRNARTAYGELDLVAVQPLPSGDACLVFVEVKTRRSASLGPPEISVNPRKQAHLIASAEAYRTAHPDLPEAYRIDVIAIRVDARLATPEIVHFENALTSA